MKIIKVGFLLNLSYSWMGEINYIKSILNVLNKYEENSIHPIVFFPTNVDSKIKSDFEELSEIKTTSLLTKGSFHYFLWRATRKLFNSDFYIELILSEFNIDIFSHSTLIGLNKSKTINWIPDFQHNRLPQMFKENEVQLRNKSIINILKKSNRIILSSNDAKNDLINYFGDFYNQKIDVLEFVSIVKKYNLQNQQNLKQIITKYNINDNFFLLPNQFWKHKNHLVVFESMLLLKNKGIEVNLVCTGLLDDYRNKNYSNSILNYIKDNQINVHMLGLIDYDDLIILIKNSIAVINPSLFEGWSTIVEECKTLGKNMIISDIPIHREQNPSNTLYFDPNQPKELADVLEAYILDQKNYKNLYDENEYYKFNNMRQSDFAKKYKTTLIKALKN